MFDLDSYQNGTLDSISAMKLAFSYSEINPEFIFIVDDDTYVNLPRLWELLYSVKEKETPLKKVG